MKRPAPEGFITSPPQSVSMPRIAVAVAFEIFASSVMRPLYRGEGTMAIRKTRPSVPPENTGRVQSRFVTRSLPLVVATALLLSCLPPRRVPIRPRARDDRGVTFLAFTSSTVERFSDAEGKPCPRFEGRVRDNLLGWQADTEDPVCTHDTLYEGLNPGALEMHWRSTLPADGSHEVISLGYSVGALGRVVSRGSYYGDYWAQARVVIEVRSPHCAASWSKDLALAKVAGPDWRVAEFSGYVELPDLLLHGCKAQDPLDVRLRLVGESNRGKIEVDWFGFSAAADDEVNRIFGVRPKPEGTAGPPAAATSKTARPLPGRP